MRAPKTTLAGTGAAICIALTQIPELPDWISTTVKILSAGFIAALGYHAAECPINCPGTDHLGRKRIALAGPLALLLIAVAVTVALVHLVGCTAPNPAHTPGNTNTPAFIVAPGLAGWSNAAVAAAQQIGPLAPGWPFLPTLVGIIFAIVGSASAWVARNRSRRATDLAAAVARAGSPTVERVLDSLDPRSDAIDIRKTVYAALDGLRASPPSPSGRPLPPDPPKRA